MNLFRSEEHVRRRHSEHPAGATIGVVQLAELARAWWGDRVAPDWQPHTREQNQAILDAVGLSGQFWRLP